MIKFFTYFVSVIFLISLNMALPNMAGAAPNLLLLFVTFYALKKDNLDFLWLAFAAGLLTDIYSSSLFSSFTISFLVVAVLINYTTRTYFTADPSIEFVSIVVAVSYIVFIAVYYGINLFGFKFHLVASPISAEYLKYEVWINLILNMVFAAPVYYFSLLSDKIVAWAEAKRLNF